MKAHPIREMLVDDHQVARHGLHSFLKTCEDLEVVGEAESSEKVLHHIEERMPDVGVMDLLMPGGISKPSNRFVPCFPRPTSWP